MAPDPAYPLDHLVVAARTLEEGVAWVESGLGAAMAGGGRHALMGTHNRVMALGGETYLEVIAIDPEAPPPARPRWFALDSAPMQALLARGPALVHWVARTAALEQALARYPEDVEVLQLSRGPYRWRMGVPRDGRLPAGGALPTLIEWQGDRHPARDLPGSGCTLLDLDTGAAPRARLVTPVGERTLAFSLISRE